MIPVAVMIMPKSVSKPRASGDDPPTRTAARRPAQ